MAPRRPITNADLYQQIGALGANVERLIEDGREANVGRQKLYERIEVIGDRMGRLEERQTTIGQRLEAMEPVVASLSEARAKASGVLLSVGVLGSIIGGLVMAYAGDLKAWIVRLFGG